MDSGSRFGWWIPALAITLPACNQPRPQLLVVVDTDAPLTGQLSAHLELSGDAAIDTVRVEWLGDSGHVLAGDDLVIPDVASWPLSFGVPTPKSSDGTLRLRLRAFLRYFLNAEVQEGNIVLNPPAEITIDRLAEISSPTEGVVRVEIFLSSDCRGIPVSFSRRTSCIDDASHLDQPAASGIQILPSGALPATRAGTWGPAIESPCGGSNMSNRICVPGGFFILGDPDSTGVGPDLLFDPVPRRPVKISTFQMDKTEFTVGRFRDLLQRGFVPPAPPDQHDGTGQECSVQNPNPELPLNCVTWQTARAACMYDGGDLPTEGQWEYVARGRGQRRHYPWGNAEPICCSASYSRSSVIAKSRLCSGAGLEPAGAHSTNMACTGPHDVSRDGIFDLGGSVTEMTRDTAVEYTAPCWNVLGILDNPVCKTPAHYHIGRGGSWSSGPAIMASVTRWRYGDNDGSSGGFRCVYPVDP